MHNPSTAKKLLRGGLVLLALFVLVYPFIYPPFKISDKPTEIEQIKSDIPPFAEYANLVEKKKAFFNYLAPEVKRQNQAIIELRHWLLAVQHKAQSTDFSLSAKDQRKLTQLRSTYKVDQELSLNPAIADLILRIDTLPLEMVLVQAANESAWGTSRFALRGYNFFGLWCFKPGCGFVPKRRADGAVNEVTKFDNVQQAVATYLTNINRHPAYQELRAIRAQLRHNNQPVSAEALIQGLMSYSERGQAYIDELLEMVRVNRKYMPL